MAVDYTVIAVVPDSRNMAYIRWRGINNDVNTSVDIPPITMDGIHYINYTYPLTINNISLSDAGLYSCIARIRSNGIMYLLDSDTVVHSATINVSCKFHV